MPREAKPVAWNDTETRPMSSALRNKRECDDGRLLLIRRAR
jgi:hypothetical protein